MNKSTSASTAAVLNDLIETCKDGQQGFQHAADNVSHAGMKDLFQRLSTQRGQFSVQLQTFVRSLGEDAENSSSLAGVLHRGWIDLKGAITRKDDKAILAECERGEDSAVAQYRTALDEELPGDIRAIVLTQCAAVKAAHDEVKALRDSAS